MALEGLEIHVLRVSTDDNIADLPSRGGLTVLKHAGAVEVKPALSDIYWKSETWDALQERWRLH